MYPLSGIIQKFKDHLKALSNELGDFAVLGILLSPDDEVDEARSVPEDGGSVRLGDPHEAGRVHLEGDGENVGLVTQLREEEKGSLMMAGTLP